MKTMFKVYDGYSIEGSNTPHARIVAKQSDGTRVSAIVPCTLLTEPKQCLKTLIDAGLKGIYHLTNAIEPLNNAIDKTTKRQVYLPMKNGWHDDAYVLNSRKVIAAKETKWEPFPAVGQMEKAARAGARDVRLIKALERAAATSDLIAFGTCLSFVGPLLRLIEESDGIIYYFSGESSTGKTTIQRIMLALTRPPGERKLKPFNFTERGLEEAAFSANDNVLCLDELDSLSVTEIVSVIRQFIYRLANGRGKVKSKAGLVGQQYPQLDWRVVCVVSGEIDVAGEFLSKKHSGQNARFIQLFVPNRAEGGVFKNGHAPFSGNAKKAIQKLNRLCESYSGHVFEDWVRFLSSASGRGDRARYREMLEEYTRLLLDGRTDSLEYRRAKKFAAVALAGRLLAEQGLFQWKPKFPFAMVKRVYRSATDASPPLSDIANRESVSALHSLLAHIALPMMPKVGKSISVATGSENAVTIETGRKGTWIKVRKEDVGAVFGVEDESALARSLERLGCLIRSSEGRTSLFSQERKKKDGKVVSQPVITLDYERVLQLAAPKSLRVKL